MPPVAKINKIIVTTIVDHDMEYIGILARNIYNTTLDTISAAHH